MLHLRDGRPAAAQAVAAFDKQVAHIKPLKSWSIDASYLRLMAMPRRRRGWSIPPARIRNPLIPLRKLQFLAAAAGFARQIHATVIMWGVQY